MRRISVIDSHTAGEPTRVIVEGGPDLGPGTLRQRFQRLREQHDWLRSASVNEPRGADAVVGALLCPPDRPDAATGVMFYNNVGYLNMCVHGTIGVAATLKHLGRIAAGRHRMETPVGDVTAVLHADGSISVENVRSYRVRAAVPIDVGGLGSIQGDVAWGGNWFFLCSDHGLEVRPGNIDSLRRASLAIRRALAERGIMGADGGEIDHIELFGPALRADCRSKNFVLCPGGAYDRSPCGTGTSAKLACLYAEGKLEPGEVWRQESIIGSSFDGSVRVEGDNLIPTITGRAWLTAESTLLIDEADPFAHGILI